MKSVPVVSDECIRAFERLSSINIQNCEDFDTLSKSVGYTDDNFVKFLQDTSYSEKTLENYQRYLQKANSATSAFSATLKSVAANVGIMLAVTAISKIATSLWDEYNVTVNEQQVKVDECTQSLATLNQEYATLNSRDYDTLSQSEKDRLEYLKERIEYEEKLLEIQKKKLNEEQVGTGFTDYFDKDSLRGKQFALTMTGDGLGEVKSNLGIYENTLNEIAELEKELLTLNPNSAAYQSVTKTIDSKNALLKDLENNLESGSGDVYAKMGEAQANAQTALDLKNSEYSSNEVKKEAEEQYKFWSGTALQYKKLYNRITNATHASQSASDSISERLGGSISAEELKSEFTSDEIGLLVGEKFDKDASIDELHTLIDTLQAEASKDSIELNIKSFEEVASSIQSLTNGFAQLDSIYADMLNGEDFDYSAFLNNEDFAATFGNLTDVTDEYKNAYSDFVETIANSNGKMTSETQDAFNKLATAYIEHGTALDTVTEATRESTVAQLEQMGVANAKQVVDERIIANTQAQAIQEQYLTQTGQVLLNQSWEQISAYLNEANAGDVAAQVMARLKLQQLDLTNNPINCAQSIYQLYALAQAAGLAGQAMENISNMNRMQKTLDTMKENGYEGTAAYLALQNRLDNLAATTSSTAHTWTDFSNAAYDFEPVKYAGGVNSLAVAQNNLAGATNDATDAAQAQINALQKEKEALEETKSEMEELHDVIAWFYDKQIDKIDEKIEAVNKENEALEKQKDHMDDIIAAIESNYDTEIQAIQDKIDALKTSNDEEERALALEEAKRKLQEAKSRKTLQVYQKGTGFTYQVDTTAIKEAENELAELQENEVTEELEKQIDKLEEAKQKWSEIPQAYEKAMQEIAASNYFGANWAATTLFPSDKLLHSFQNNYTGIQSDIAANEGRIESYEVEKEAVENLKQLWDDAKNAYTYAEYEKKLQTFIGSDYEYELLNNSAIWREEYATKYAEICAQIGALEEQIKLASEATSTSVSNIGTAAQTSADQVNALSASLDALNGKVTESTHTHTNITRNITYSESSPYGPGNPYQSATDHAKSHGNDYAISAGYAKGGIITRKAAGNLDYVAKALGEDHMVAVQEGEAVIPKKSVKANESLVRSLINGNIMPDADMLQENYARLMSSLHLNVLKFQPLDYEELVSRQAANKVVQFNGDIHVHEIQNADELSRAIVTKLPMTMLQELNRRDF